MWRPIEDSSELVALSPEQLIRRVWPLLARRGSFATSKQWRERARANIPSVCAELALEWRHSPRLRGREVGFGEYLAARLCTTLHELDQAQQPHLYDSKRRYLPEGEPLGLLEEYEGEERPRAGPPATPDHARALLEQELDPRERMQAALTGAGIAPASQPGVFALAAGFQSGSISSAYLTARAQGYTPLEARNHPATAVHRALEALPGATGWRYA